MTSVHLEDAPDTPGAGARLDAVVVEVRLLVTARDAAALEAAAHRRGLTVGQMVRRLIQDYRDRVQIHCTGIAKLA